jgi:CO/xanthine dehydrogenase Mo-binding subunit
VTFNTIGFVETLQAVKESEHYKSPVKPGHGRGVAAGFWFNIGADSSAATHVGEDGSVTVISGNPDIGGSRASLALMAAEELGVDYSKVRPVIADTASIGFNFVTGGSRVTFATGLAVVNATRDLVRELKARAAKIWEVEPDAVEWRDGQAWPASTNVGVFEPLSLGKLAAMAGKTGGPINGHAQLNAQGAGPGFGVHIADLRVDPETGVSIEVFFSDRTLETFGRCGSGWFWCSRRRGFSPAGAATGPFATSYSAYRHAMQRLGTDHRLTGS